MADNTFPDDVVELGKKKSSKRSKDNHHEESAKRLLNSSHRFVVGWKDPAHVEKDGKSQRKVFYVGSDESRANELLEELKAEIAKDPDSTLAAFLNKKRVA